MLVVSGENPSLRARTSTDPFRTEVKVNQPLESVVTVVSGPASISTVAPGMGLSLWSTTTPARTFSDATTRTVSRFRGVGSIDTSTGSAVGTRTSLFAGR